MSEPTKPTRRRPVNLNVRLTEEEAEILASSAKRLGVSQSFLIRVLITNSRYQHLAVLPTEPGAL